MIRLALILALWSPLALAAPPTEREAKALLASPRGSTSLGRTSDGGLENPAALPKRGKGYALLSMVVPRKTNYGTTELIEAIERAAARVAERFPGSVLGVGNLGFADGRKIPWSVSHQAGRDGDLGMYATLPDGSPWEAKRGGPMPFFNFGEDLTARAQGTVVRFDVKRNLALVQALVEDPEARVQYIFVASWLKKAMLEEGRRQGVSGQTLARLGEVMHQPTDSNPHADHYHLRLFCTIEDRTFGCIDRAPPRSWVDPGDREHAEAVRKVSAILEMPDKRHESLVLRALDRLGAMRAYSAVGDIANALADPRKKVRQRALDTLELIADPRAADAIAAALPKVEDAAWAAKLFAIIPKLNGATGPEPLLGLARRTLEQPGAVLHPRAKKAEEAVLVASLAVLRDHGSSADGSVELALARLGHKSAAVKKAAEAVLAHHLCRPIRKGEAAALSQDARGKSPVALAESGLRAMKLLTAKPTKSRAAVRELIGLLDRRQSEVRVCAQRLLESLTGHESDARLRGPARNKKHWTNWWREQEAESGLP